MNHIEVFGVVGTEETTRNPNYALEVNTYYDDKAVFAVFATEKTARSWMESYQIDGDVVCLTGRFT